MDVYFQSLDHVFISHNMQQKLSLCTPTALKLIGGHLQLKIFRVSYPTLGLHRKPAPAPAQNRPCLKNRPWPVLGPDLLTYYKFPIKFPTIQQQWMMYPQQSVMFSLDELTPRSISTVCFLKFVNKYVNYYHWKFKWCYMPAIFSMF